MKYLALWCLRLAAVLALGLAAALAQDADKEMRSMNNFVHEHTNCAAYFAVSSQCLKSRNDSVELSEKMQQLSGAAYSRGMQYGDAIKLSRKVHPARLEMAINIMMADMDKNCANISIILNQYAYACKRLMENPEEALDRLLAGRPLKD